MANELMFTVAMRVANFNQEGGRFFTAKDAKEENANALTTKETKGTKEKQGEVTANHANLRGWKTGNA